MTLSFQINNINQYLVNKKKLSCRAKYLYISLLLKKQTFSPFYKKIEAVTEQNNLSKAQIYKILKELEDSKLLKRHHNTIDTKDRKIGNSLFLQLVPPQPYRFLKGEFIQLDKKQCQNELFQTICLKNIRDLNDDDFMQEFHFIHFADEDKEHKKALDGMERGFDLYFVAEVKVSDSGGQWLDHDSHLTNDWLMRKQEEALEAIEKQEVIPSITQVESPRSSFNFFMELLAI